jgi:hypothetical protein
LPAHLADADDDATFTRWLRALVVVWLGAARTAWSQKDD